MQDKSLPENFDPEKIFRGDELEKLIRQMAQTIAYNNISAEGILKCLPVLGEINNYGLNVYDVLLKIAAGIKQSGPTRKKILMAIRSIPTSSGGEA